MLAAYCAICSCRWLSLLADLAILPAKRRIFRIFDADGREGVKAALRPAGGNERDGATCCSVPNGLQQTFFLVGSELSGLRSRE